MTKLKKFLSVLMIGMMLSGIISSAVPAAAAYTADEKAITQVRTTKSIRLKYPNYYLAPGYKFIVSAQALDENGKFIKEDTFTWKMEGGVYKWDGNNLQEKENCTYLEDRNDGRVVLHIADNEPAGEITITATSNAVPEISSSCTLSIETDEKIPVRMEMEMWKIVEEEGDEIGLQELESDGEKSFLEPGADAEISIKAYTANGIYIWNYHDTFQWEIEGTSFPWEDISHMSEPVKARWTYFNPEEQILHIGTEKDLIEKEITLKATSKTNPSLCAYGKIAVRELPLTDCVILQKVIPESYTDAGSNVEIFATAYDQKDKEIEDTFTWEIEGTENLWDKNSGETPDEKEKYTYLEEESPRSVILHIGTEEPDKRMITVKATSEMNPEISDSLRISVRKPEITKIEIVRDYEEYIKPGEEADIWFEAHIYNQYDEEVEDTLTWSVTYSDEKRGELKVWDGNSDTQPNEEETYVQYEENSVWLHIGTKEPKRSSITVKAVSGSSPKVSSYSGVTVWEGVWLEFDPETLSARIRTNGDDSFLFLEIAKNEDMLWQGKATPYCYEGNDVTVDLSFLNISNEMYFQVYGDQNREALDIDQIYAIPKEEKASLKYKHDPELYDAFEPYNMENSFTFGEETDPGAWEYRHQGSGTWHPLWDLEDELEHLRVSGTTLLIRQYMGDIDCVPGKETKLKIPAVPKAPKVKLNYTKNTVTFTGDSEIFVSGWRTFAKNADGNGYHEEPYYYYLEVDEEDSSVKKWMLNPDIEWLAYDLAEDYVQSYNSSINMLRREGIWWYEKKTKEDVAALREELLTKGFKLVVRTNTQKKGPSQFVLKEINPVPAIEIVSGSAINKIAVVTVDEQGNKEYGNDYVTFQYGTDKKGKAILTLTSSGDKTFAYSTNYWDADNPSKAKFTKIKTTGTVINLDKLKDRDITIRMEGVENKKDASKSRWASNVVDIPR